MASSEGFLKLYVNFRVLVGLSKTALMMSFKLPLVTQNDFHREISINIIIGGAFWRLITFYFASMCEIRLMSLSPGPTTLHYTREENCRE